MLVPMLRRTLLRPRWSSRLASTATPAEKDRVKFLVVGGGTAGINIAHQLFYRFSRDGSGSAPKAGDIAIADASPYHFYQPGWTLAGAGLLDKESTRRPLPSLIPKLFHHFPENVQQFDPTNNAVTLTSGRTVTYDFLVIATGLQINWSAISGLEGALADPHSGVSSIYSYTTCDKTWADISALRTGTALFTQPAGVIKCAGAPQKVMWCAWDHLRKRKLAETTRVEFWSGMPTMFSVPKYSNALDALRQKRGIRGEFGRNLVSVDSGKRTATFKKPDGSTEEAEYTILHVTPPMGPLDVLKGSPLADAAGWVDVDPATLQHRNEKFANVFALGDASSLPTSKTAAAIAAQSPVLAENLYQVAKTGKVGIAAYDGYTSCPLLTGDKELMLAEFKYGLEPVETFSRMFGIDQAVPRRAFFHLKKDIFPRVYWKLMTKGMWFGPKGLFAPRWS